MALTKDGSHKAEYEHLEKIVNRVIAEKPKDAYGLVEVLSRMVREPTAAAPPLSGPDAEAAAATLSTIKALDAAPAEEGAVTAVAGQTDFVEEADMLAWAGVGFGELESYKVKCSLRNLAAKQADEGFTKLRLWGKILGVEADYYVAEASKDGAEDVDAENPDIEPAGVGANKYVYLVTTDLASGVWNKLPNIKPNEITAARRIKRLMSGSPTAKVVTHPPYPGTEEVLLRAQIARITADTTLCFKDWFKREGNFGDEDAGEPALFEEFVYPPAASLVKMEAWQHRDAHILQIGRTTHREPPEEDEENPEQNALRKKMLAEQESDPVRDPIRSMAGDGLEWVIKQSGDTCLYKSTALDAVPKSNAVTCVRSLTWPGAVTVSQGTTVTNLYVGYGMPVGEQDFFPYALPDVQEEPEEIDEQPEPQGSLEEEAPPAEE